MMNRQHVRSRALERRRDLLVIGLLLIVAALMTAASVSYAALPPPPEVSARLGWEIIERHALARWQFPLWNPYYFGGQPLLENAQALALYPPHLLLHLAPLQVFLPLTFAFHLFAAAIGGYFIGRQLEVTRLTSVAMALAAMLLAASTGGPENPFPMYAAAWVPLTLACAMRSFRRHGPVPAPALVAVVTTVFLLGSLRAAAYAIGAVIAAVAFDAIGSDAQGRTRHSTVHALLACVLAAGVSAAQTLPAYGLHKSLASGDVLMRSTDVPVVTPADAAVSSRPVLTALRGARVLATCDEGVATALAELRASSVGGHGVYRREYARFARLAAGAPARDEDAPYRAITDTNAIRPDLVALLGAEWMLSCGGPQSDVAAMPDRWGISRPGLVLPRAMWTCAPTAMPLEEAEFWLARRRYNTRLELGAPSVIVHVRWAPTTTEQDRATAERRLLLNPIRSLGDRTWEYELTDSSPGNVAAIVRDPLVEDTAGIDRGNLHVAAIRPHANNPRPSEWLVGDRPCGQTTAARVITADRFDGTMVMGVDAPADGIVFVSDTYYDGREARVDGRRTPVLRADLTFTAVPVPAGTHTIELRYRPNTVLWGAALSIVALLAWCALEWIPPGRLSRRKQANAAASGSVMRTEAL